MYRYFNMKQQCEGECTLLYLGNKHNITLKLPQ